MQKITLTTLLCLSVVLVSRTATAQEASPLELAKTHLYAKYPSLQTQPTIDWVVTDEVKNNKNNVTHLYLRQSWDGIEITNINLNVAILNGKIVSMTGRVLTPEELESKKSKGGLSQEQAIFKAADQLGIPYSSSLQRVDVPNRRGATAFKQAELSQEFIPVKQVFWLSPKNELKLAYDLSMYPPNQHDWWSLRIDAETGEILERGNWVVKCTFDEQHTPSTSGVVLKSQLGTTAEVNGGEQYNVFAMPLESPNHGDRSVVSSPFNPAASPFGWHDTNGAAGAEFTITRGNNVHAYEDSNADNLPGFSPDGGALLSFNFNYLSDGNPDNYRNASITNLFYWNNIIHDVLYEYGFDEPSGNFQQRNYSGAGLGNDYVNAEDLDGSGTNNANFGTPPDGQNPRMQMFLWSSGGSVNLVITSPAQVAGTYAASPAQFGPSLISNPLSGQFVFVSDGTANPTRACSPIVNASEVAGKIAVVDRGDCNFTVKVKNAQNAGAIGVLVLSNSDEVTALGGTDATITIPSLIVTLSTANTIRSLLSGAQGSLQNNTFFLSGGFDNGIITHEYGHGVSNRLTGGPSAADCLQSAEQMGEGWSDYLGLMLTMKPGDNATTARGIGTYAVGQATTGNGIRPARYTTNMAVNPWTYAGVANTAQISSPHGIGFIWCTMLWDMTWLFVDRYGFDPDIQNGNGGNNMALQLVMDGMKLQPCNPGFVDGRDAILLADKINNGGANQDIIWEAFARRGLGYSARQGSAGDRMDGTEAFDIPQAIQLASEVDIYSAQVGQTVSYTMGAENIFPSPQSNVVIRTTIPENSTLIEGTIAQNTTSENGFVYYTSSSLDGLTSVSHWFSVEINAEAPATQAYFYDGHEAGASKWITQILVGGNGWGRTSQGVLDGSIAWFVPNAGFATDLVLRTANALTIQPNSKLAFWHWFDTEADFDGGVIEISTDGGTTWQDLGSRMLSGAYNDVIVSETYNRSAFAGRSGGYMKTLIDLSNFSGTSGLFRFRFLSDGGVRGDGWKIDNVYIFTGDEATLSAESCLIYDGQANESCTEIETTIFDSDISCQPYAGFVSTSHSLTLLTAFCEDDLSQLTFGVNFGAANINNPGASYGYAYIISSQTAPYEIVATNTTGQFAVADLTDGAYKMWGLSYAVSNDEESVTSFVNSKANVESIVNEIGTGAICAAISDKYLNGTTTNFTKIECVVQGLPLEDTSFINVYPNPSKGVVSVQLMNHVGKSADVLIYNLSGQLMKQQQFRLTSDVFVGQVNHQELNTGLYLIEIRLDNQRYVGRLLVE